MVIPPKKPEQVARDLLDNLTTNDKGLRIKKAEAYAMLALVNAINHLAGK